MVVSHHKTTTSGGTVNWTLELVILPVSDVDRARDFYAKIGFNVDHDHTVSEDVRFVQMTPPGSACSIAIGKGLTDAEPGSVKGMQVVVTDINAARDQLLAAGVDPGEVDVQPWGHFVYFADPDGNQWAVQYMPYRDN
ncbi:glyoxalase superfamily protein [Gordonia sp. GN26]